MPTPTTPRRSTHAIAVLLAAVLWGTTGTVAHFAPVGSSPLAIGLATFGIGGLVLAALSARRVLAVLRQRAAVRERRPEHGSDATWPVIAAQLKAREPLDDIPPASLLALETDRPVDACLDQLDAFVSAALDA